MQGLERKSFSPDELESETAGWHWEPAETAILKDLVVLGQVRVDFFHEGRFRQDIILIRSDGEGGPEKNSFNIEILPASFKKVIDTARASGKARANILTLLYLASDRTQGSRSVYNANYRKDEIILDLTEEDSPSLSTTYLGGKESGWIFVDHDLQFPDIQIV